jgi:hypothetical protein
MGWFPPYLGRPAGSAALRGGKGGRAMFELSGVMDVIRHAFALGVLVIFLALVLALVWVRD